MPVIVAGTYDPFAYESLTVANAAKACTSATYTSSGAKGVQAFMTLETAQVRWRIDGSDPTSSEGHLLEVGQTLKLENLEQVKQFRAIRTGATSGVLKTTYLKR